MKTMVGTEAPRFSLLGADGHEHCLDQYRGRVVVVLFYVSDNTPTCSRQLAEYNLAYKSLKERGVVFLGISPNSSTSQYAFSCRLDLQFPLLSDTTHETSKAYGAQMFAGIYRRSAFVIDQGGVVRFQHRAGLRGYATYAAVSEALGVVQELLGDGLEAPMPDHVTAPSAVAS